MGTNVGMCFDRSLPAPFVVEVAERLENGGVDQLWVIEDCFYTAGISLAATAPGPYRTLDRRDRNPARGGAEPGGDRRWSWRPSSNLAPGRLLAGIGHGVQEWMDQMGARTRSPLTTLEEAITIVRRLLHGETVTFAGR